QRSRHGGISEQRGRGTDTQFRMRMPARFVEVGQLPYSVRRLCVQEQQTAALIGDRRPQPVADRELALAVAEALRNTSRPDSPTLLVAPLYPGGQNSLVFAGLSVKRLDRTEGRPVATSVLVKV